MLKLDVTGAYHHISLQPSQVGVFVHIISSVPEDYVIIICINLVLPIGWEDWPKFFCAFLEMLTNVANDLVDAYLPVPAYGAISVLPATDLGPPHTPESLTHIDCYMDNFIYKVQGGGRATTPSL